MSIKQEFGTQQRWSQLLKDYFATSLDENEAKRWMEEIQIRYRFMDDARLCQAIRWASDTRNYNRHDKKGRVTVPEVEQWIRMSYRAENAEESARVLCASCGGSGWTPYVRDLGAAGFTYAEYCAAITSVIPCACSSGSIALKKHYPDMKESEQREVAKFACRQRCEFLRLGEELERKVHLK